MASPRTMIFDFYRALTDAGIALPDNTKRIVIDCNVDSAINVYYETYSSEEMLDVVVESLMRNKKDIVIKEVK